MEGYSIVVGLLLTSSFFLSEACNDELQENMNFPESDITILHSPTAEHCQYLCTQHPECLFFSFVRPDWTSNSGHFKCYLKSTSSGQPLSKTTELGVTSGFSLKSCNPNSRPCFSQVFQNVHFDGGDYRTLFTLDHEACQRVCTQDPECQFFTFNKPEFETPNLRYKCQLKYSWNVPRTPVVKKVTGITSGFSQKIQQTQVFDTVCPNQFFPNTDIPGSDLEELQSISAEHCQSLCSAHPKCSYFSFSSENFKCYLKNNFITMEAEPKAGVTSGIPGHFCLLDDNWVTLTYEDTDFWGSDIRYELMDSPEVCRLKCDEDPNCQFYVYCSQSVNLPEYRRRCYLKRVITMPAPSNVTNLANVVSGFSLRNCN